MKKLICILFVFIYSTALADININNSTPFPYSATTDNTTYNITEDITCDKTCFVLSCDNAVFELNGHTITFGNANAVTVLNSDFENWTGSVPNNWEVVSGSVTSTPAIDLGTTMLTSSDGFILKSDAFTLKGGKTYQLWATVKSNAAASYVLKLLDASTDAVLETGPTITGTALSRGFASNGDPTTDSVYKPNSDISVKIQIEATGTYTWYIEEINIAPTDDYGFTSDTWKDPNLSADISATWGSTSNVTIQNGTILQGAGHGTRSYAIKAQTVNNVDVIVTGPNSAGIKFAKTVTDSSVTYSGAGKKVFNRMYAEGASGYVMSKGWTGDILIDNLTVTDYPEYGIIVYNCPTNYDDTSVEITNSTFNGDGKVTEPYAMVLSGAKNIDIHHNTIDPAGKVGRGILIDPIGCVVEGQIQAVTGKIHHNSISNIWEDRNFEYASNSLEAAGIRIRNGAVITDGHQLDIYDNTISVYTTASGAHGAYGINIKGESATNNILVHNNVISAINTDNEFAAGIAMQDVSNENGGVFKIYQNTISTNDQGIKFGGNDGEDAIGVEVYLNKVTASAGNPVWFYDWTADHNNNKIYCNQFITESTDPPIYVYGDTSANFVNTRFDYNMLQTAGTYEVYIESDRSEGLLFFGNGTINVTGGGLVGAAGSATNGSENCWTTAGVISGQRYAVRAVTKE